MRIGELSKKTGVSVRALRYYDQKQLLRSKRGENGYRIFDEESVERVRLIQLYLGLGLNTKQIEQILRCKDFHEKPIQDDLCEELLFLYQSRLNEIDEQISQLSKIRDQLQSRISDLEERLQTYNRATSSR